MRLIFLFFFLISATLAVLATPTYEEAGMFIFEDPSDPLNSIIYFLVILAFTALILLTIKFKKFIIFLIYFLTFISIYYILTPFLQFFSLAVAILIILILIKKPNWITINISAILLSSGIAAMFGISLEPVPAIILLLVLAIYDFVAVHKTKHMIKLAETAAEIRAPILFEIPFKGERAYMGLGDVIIPSILIVSAQRFSESSYILFFKIPALTTLIFSLIALLLLIILVERKEVVAGLPVINSGAILGFILGCNL